LAGRGFQFDECRANRLLNAGTLIGQFRLALAEGGFSLLHFGYDPVRLPKRSATELLGKLFDALVGNGSRSSLK
jgi:hypothetical protein